MHDTQSQTESVLDIVHGVEQRTIMLPEFQRDFRWELEQSYDLFDSLVSEIFIGTIIYGKPSFAMTLREIDKRKRKGVGSNAALPTYDYSAESLKQMTQTKNLRIVLDGQQRITSIYRAVTGLDTIYIVLRDNLDPASIDQLKLEEIVEEVGGEESATAVSIKLADAYNVDRLGLEGEDMDEKFANTLYGRKLTADADRKAAQRLYRRGVRKLIDLLKQQKLVAFYLLDMSLEKFCVFFERSNSRGIQLNFTDILAAKLYRGFNLRKKIEEFESSHRLKLNREIVVRAIAYICGVERGGTVKIDKKAILEMLDASDFVRHWDSVCMLYAESFQYLRSQHYILSQDWMPSENMIIPLMVFRRQVKSFDQVVEAQRRFLEFWYWGSIFANRYSSASNETIITDCAVLTQIAQGERIEARSFFPRMRSLIAEPEDLFNYTKRGSALYRGVLNLINYEAQGLRDWNSHQKIDLNMRLEDHHIYPRAYIASRPQLDMDAEDAEQLVDCVVNRTLMPKLTNIQVGKKPPQVYLSELSQKNSQLSQCLAGHIIHRDMVIDATWNGYFKLFLDERAGGIFALIDKYAIAPTSAMIAGHGSLSLTLEQTPTNGRSRLKDMIVDGRVFIGERVHVRKHPEAFACIIDGDTVEYNGNRTSINIWGQQMTGWSSINIYEQVLLERTGAPLKSLRRPEDLVT